MEVKEETTRRRPRRRQRQTHADEISHRTPAQHTHTYINKHKHIFTCSWAHGVPDASESVTFSQEGTKERRCAPSLYLLRSSTWRDFFLGSFNLHRAENPHEGCSVAFPGGRHRQTVNISCLQRFWAHEELWTRWNAVWWLNQGVRNQLDEPPGIKATERTLSLRSLGSHSSKGIGDRFGPQKKHSVNLSPLPVILCCQTLVTVCLLT